MRATGGLPRAIGSCTVVVALLAACATTRAPGASDDFEVRALVPGVHRHVSFHDVPGFGRFPSNGLVVEGPDALLVIDGPWTPAQAERLLVWAREVPRKPVRAVVVTHAHDDRFGGAAVFAAAGATVFATPETATRVRAQGIAFEAEPLPLEEPLLLAGSRIEAFFPGHAHAPDNVVVWLPDARVLHGGCMVRSASDTGVGNRADADLASWAKAIRRVRERYGSASIVVPGHGEPGDAGLLDHTRSLVDAANEPQ